jgi:threonine dehydrogenase-like Zn-dependent dehydrogenase
LSTLPGSFKKLDCPFERAIPAGSHVSNRQLDYLVGSNAFGVEEVDGVRKHAIEHYLEMARTGRVDVRPMLTHTFALDDWRAAFETLAKQHDTGAIKAAFDFRDAS